jgi:hypothetical protein
MSFIILIIYIALLGPFVGLTIYMYILIIKLARRGIKALDLYIDDKTRRYVG